MWSGERLTKVQTTTRLDHVWPEVWINLSKAAERREKEEWANEKPKLGNARKMRGIDFLDLENKEYEETIKEARKKFGSACGNGHAVQEEQSKPVVLSRLGAPNKVPQTKYACIMEPHESTRQRVELTLQRSLEDHIAAKEEVSVGRYNLEHKFIPMLKAMKILDAKAVVEK